MIQVKPKFDYKYSYKFAKIIPAQNLLITMKDIANKVYLIYLHPDGRMDGHVTKSKV